MAYLRGSRDPFRTARTGLCKTSVVKGIQEAVQLGILRKRHHSSERSGNLTATYSIQWQRVEELVKQSKNPKTKVKIIPKSKRASLV